eukprot:gene12016-biopygen3400
MLELTDELAGENSPKVCCGATAATRIEKETCADCVNGKTQFARHFRRILGIARLAHGWPGKTTELRGRPGSAEGLPGRGHARQLQTTPAAFPASHAAQLRLHAARATTRRRLPNLKCGGRLSHARSPQVPWEQGKILFITQHFVMNVPPSVCGAPPAAAAARAAARRAAARRSVPPRHYVAADEFDAEGG